MIVLVLLLQLEHWKPVESTLSIVDDALRWKAENESSTLSAEVVPASAREIARIVFRVRADEERTLLVRLRSKDGFFWRKIVAPTAWTDVSLAPWQFRSDGTPSWEKLSSLEFAMRDAPGTVLIDGLRVEKQDAAGPTWLEPDDALVARAFKDARRAKTASFRVFACAPLDADKIGANLEEFLTRFQKTWGLAQAPLDYPATLVVTKTRDEYAKFVEATCADVYASVHRATDVRSAGFTFEQYSATSYLESAGERRPVFYHEVCHQLTTRLLGLRGPNGRATWIEEGICYFLQNEFLPQPNLADEVKKMLENPRRPALERLDARVDPSGVVNMQGMTLAAFLASRKEHRAEAMAALREGASLKRAVAALKMTMDDFAKEWEAFVRERWKY